MGTIRAFVAIELCEEWRRALAAAQARLKPVVDARMAWTRPEGIHLTLKFLGDVDDGKVQAIGDAMARAAANVRPFTLALGEIGGFPDLERPRVIWVGLAGEVEALLGLQRAVEREIGPLGFPPEGRPFAAHLTLGRVKAGVARWDRRAVEQAAARAIEGAPQFVTCISLMQSELQPGGAVYRQVRETRLGGGLS